MANLRPANNQTEINIDLALNALRLALSFAKQADAPRLTAAIRKALKSADGARRHASRRSNATLVMDDKFFDSFEA